MNILVIYYFLALILFTITSTLGRRISNKYTGISDIKFYSGTSLQEYFIVPSGYIILVYIIANSLRISISLENIWLIVPLYFINIFLILLILGRIRLIKIELFLLLSLISSGVAYLVDITLLSQGLDYLNTTIQDSSKEILLLLAGLGFIWIKDLINSDLNNAYNRKSIYFKEQGKFIGERFKKVLNVLKKNDRDLIISILVFENYQRPKFIRVLEKLLNTRTQGIAQRPPVKSTYKNLDEKSISELVKEFSNFKKSNNDFDSNDYYKRRAYLRTLNNTELYVSEVENI